MIEDDERTIAAIRIGDQELPVVRRVRSADDTMEKYVLDFMPNEPGVILFWGAVGECDHGWQAIFMLALAFGPENVNRKAIDHAAV